MINWSADEQFFRQVKRNTDPLRPATLVVDEQPLIRYAVRSLLEELDIVRYVVEAGTEEAALRECDRHNPELVITELAFSGGLGGTTICRHVKKSPDPALVCILANDSSSTAVAAALNAGADSFIRKSATDVHFVDAVRRTWAGQRVWLLGADDEDVATELPATPGAAMTRREEEILALILCRWSNEEIADELHLARQTVKNYSSRILQKLGYGSRRELFRSLDIRTGVYAVPPRRH